MSVQLFAHPFSSYCQKVLIALYENATPFEFRMLDDAHPENGAELAALWPLGKFPVLVDGGQPVIEASIIIEHLDVHHPGATRLVPADPAAALDVRFLERFYDNYVMTPMTKIVFDAIRAPETRDPFGVGEARSMLEKSYGWLDARLGDRTWATGDAFTLADCAAAPALFYADWVHPIPVQQPRLAGYRARLLARPSVARCVEEARPYRPFFPPGAPDRD